MTKKTATQLRLHVEQHPDEQPVLPITQLAPLPSAFEQATGWQLRLEKRPTAPDEVWSTTICCDSGSAGRLVLGAPRQSDGPRVAKSCTAIEQVRPLALAIGGLVNEIQRLRQAVWQREAELAAGVPVASRSAEEAHLAERLEAVLKSGAEAVGCPAAGLYLLDEATSELKLRAAFGLPQERLLAPARPLRGAVADLEALVGHAVVLEDTSVLPHWRCPEDFPAAVCVPVASPSIPLGTLWVFSDRQRDFSAAETNLLEIIAGRLAADLEREILLAVGTQAKQRDKQFDVAARWQSDRLPSVPPLIEGYEVAGWTSQAQGVGGDFYDWSVTADGRLSLVVGDAEGDLLEAALGAASLHSAVKAHSAYRHNAGELLVRVNESLLAASPGDQRASLAYALIEPETGEIQLALAGNVAAMIVGPDDRMVTTTDSPRLGEVVDFPANDDRARLHRGEALVLISGGVRGAADGAGLRIGEAALASLVANHLCDSAQGIVTRLRRLMDQDELPADDLTVLVVKRR